MPDGSPNRGPFTRKTSEAAVGTPDGAHRRIAIGFDHETFWLISDLARWRNISFNEQVRRLVKDALGRSDSKETTR